VSSIEHVEVAEETPSATTSTPIEQATGTQLAEDAQPTPSTETALAGRAEDIPVDEQSEVPAALVAADVTPPSDTSSSDLANPQLPTPDSNSSGHGDLNTPLVPFGATTPANLLLPEFSSHVRAVVQGDSLPDLAPPIPADFNTDPTAGPVSPYFADEPVSGGYFDMPVPAAPREAGTPVATPRPADALRRTWATATASMHREEAVPEAGPSTIARTVEGRVPAVDVSAPSPRAVFVQEDLTPDPQGPEAMDVSDHDSIASSRADDEDPKFTTATDEEDKTLEQPDFSTPPAERLPDPAKGVPEAQAQEIVAKAAEELDAAPSVAQDRSVADAQLTPTAELPGLAIEEDEIPGLSRSPSIANLVPAAALVKDVQGPEAPADNPAAKDRVPMWQFWKSVGEQARTRPRTVAEPAQRPASEVVPEPIVMSEEATPAPSLGTLTPVTSTVEETTDKHEDEDAEGSDNEEYMASQATQDSSGKEASPTPEPSLYAFLLLAVAAVNDRL
jgi:hypothetical protein